jgi:NAD(P)-dependent dehydrogenase (short-subunit alcohol dehydrogenase family)
MTGTSETPIGASRRRGGNGNEKLALVTGAAGFTGGHLAHALLRRGHRVRALVRSRAQAAG